MTGEIGHANGQLVKAQFGIQGDFFGGLGRNIDAVCAVDLFADDLQLLCDRQIQRVQEFEMGRLFGSFYRRLSQLQRTGAAIGPMSGDDRIHSAGRRGGVSMPSNFSPART